MHPAELVSTGAELLLGARVNTHARQLAQSLEPLQVSLQRDVTVRDDLDVIAESVRAALDRVDLVFVTGGLGPTVDDVTRDAVAAALDRRVVLDEAYARIIQRGYQRAGRAFTESARRQALVVEGATTLSNAAGVAPGERIELPGNKVIFLLPGPPRELLAILDQHIVPWLRDFLSVEDLGAESVMMVAGIGESDLVTRLHQAGLPPAGIDVAYCAHLGELEVRFSAAGHASELEPVLVQFRELVGSALFAEERTTLERSLGERLARTTQTVSVVETTTGGLVLSALAGQVGSLQKTVGGLVLLDHQHLQTELAIDPDLLAQHGAVSEPIARRLAEAVRIRFGSTLGVAVSGPMSGAVAGQDRPDGTAWVAVSDGVAGRVRSCRMPGDAEWCRQRVAKFALNQVRLFLRSSDQP